MKSLTTLFRFNYFRTKLLFSYLLIALIPAVFVGFASYHATYNQMQQQTISLQNIVLTNTAHGIVNRMNDSRRVSELTQYYYTLYFYPQDEHSLYEDLLRTQQLKSNLSLLCSRFDIHGVYIYFSDEIVFSNEGIIFFPLSTFPAALESLSFHDAPTTYSDRDYWCYCGETAPPSKTLEILRLVRTIRGPNDDQIVAGYFIDINFSDIRSFIDNIADSQNADFQGSCGLLNEDGTLLYLAGTDAEESETSRQLPQEIFQQNLKTTKAAGYLYNMVQIPDTQWILFSRIPLASIQQQAFVVSQVALIVALLAVVLAVLVSFFMSRILSNKLSRLTNAMQKLQPGLTNIQDIQLLIAHPEKENLKSAQKTSRDELDQLIDTYNIMIQRIQDLMETVVLHETAAEKQKIALLQAQIKPHFLYNVLASIQASVTAGNTEEANHILQQLAFFYRAHLRAPGDLLTLGKELESALAYLRIESLCYPGKLFWENKIPLEWKDFLIPHFTLQPIIENCVNHAMRAENIPLHIVLSVRAKNDTLLLTVQDDGIGIPPNQLRQIQQQLEENQQISSDHFGIFNAHARLRLYLGDSYGLNIDSEQGKGTIVTICLPLSL